MQETLRTYLELAMGLTETSSKKVRKVVNDVVGKGGATAEQAKALTNEMLAVNSANREALAKLVRFEVDRALGLVGLATAEEVEHLTARVHDLERQLREAKAAPAVPASDEPTHATKATVANKTPAPKKTAAAKKTAAPKKTAAAKKATTAAKRAQS